MDVKNKTRAELVAKLDNLQERVKELETSESILQNRRQLYRRIIEEMQSVYYRTDLDGKILMVSNAIQNMLGYTRQTALGKNVKHFYKNPKKRKRFLEKLHEQGSVKNFEIELKHKNGKTITAIVNSHFVHDQDDQITGIEGNLTDITLYKYFESGQNLTIEILNIFHNYHEPETIYKKITGLMQNWSGCDAVGIRLENDGDYPYFETRGFPSEFVASENSLCAEDEDGQIIRDFEGNPVLECMCGNVIRGRYDPELPFFTEFGSFWTNSTTKLLESTSEEDRQARTRNRCNGEGYESVALIPLRFNGQTLGLLQFNDSRPNNFTSDLISQLEQMAANLALALSERRNVQNLVESENRFQKLFNKLEDAVVLSPISNSEYTLPDNIKHVNKAACKLSGYSVEELTKMKLWDLEISHKRSQDINTLMRQIIEEGRTSFESQIKTKNGDKIDIEVNSSLFKYHGQNHILSVARNCTNRKNMERELRKNKKRYQALYENAPLPYQSLDKQGYIIDVNPKWLSTLGYERGQVIGKYFADFLHPQDVEKFQKEFNQFVKNGEINDVHYKLQHKEGHYIHVSFTGHISYDQDGKFQQTYCVFQDITRQKRIEETLHQTENRYQHLIQASTNHMFMLTPEGYYLLSNDQVQHFGFKRGSKIVGLNVIEIYDLAIGNIYKKKLDQVIETRQPVTFEYTFQINNEQRYHQDTLYPVVKDDKVWAIGGIGRDISKRKNEEIALQEREAELSTILKNVPVAIATIRKDKNDLKLYHISRNLTNLADSIKTPGDDIILHCLDCTIEGNECLLGVSNKNCKIKTLILDTFNKGKVYYLEEMELNLDDKKHWFLISTTPINVDDERRVLLSMFDITERKRAELRLRKTMQHLNNLEENFRQQASQKLHDHVGQNLTALTFNLDHIYNQLPEEYSSRIEKKFQDSMVILNDTIESIRDIISEMRPAVLEDYGLYAAIKWYGEKFSERTNIRFKINGQKPSSRLSDDVEITIFRVIEELFNNIAKHSKANNIFVDFSENEHYIELLVQDDGIGFDIKEAKERQNATGLGIVNIEDRISSIGGDFWLDSRPGQGTKVKIKLEHQT